jgi:protocatechuate 3,4-dioxygenase beta subunit
MPTTATASTADKARAAAGAPRRTPGMLLGPFYPLAPGANPGGNLWDGTHRPDGARDFRLEGRVRNLAGAPVADATVELWHADPAGRYRHPSAPGAGLVLAGFSGYGRVPSSGDGRFVFSSLLPGGYAEGEVVRAPHLHLQITGRVDRLVTQLFLPQHPGNASDPLYRALVHPRRLTVEAIDDDAGPMILRWTAVLASG